MKCQLYIFLLVICAGFTNVHTMNRHQNTIDLNQVHEYLELLTGAANLITASQVTLPSNPTPDDPDLRAITQLMQQQNSHVNVIPLNERYERAMCTRMLTSEIKNIYGHNMKSFHGYKQNDPDSVNNYLPEVIDDIAVALYHHGDLQLPAEQ